MGIQILNKQFDYSLEPHRAILFEDVKSNYASIECIERGLNPLTTSLCVMSRADNSNGLILAASPTFKKVFGMSNVSHSKNFRSWYITVNLTTICGTKSIQIFLDKRLNLIQNILLKLNVGQDKLILFLLKCCYISKRI